VANKPNLFFVGFPKSGTTAIAQYLDDHPEVVVSRPKEPNFLLKERREKAEKFLKEVPLSKRRHLKQLIEVNNEKEYHSCFKEEARWYCDASVGYIGSETALQRINRKYPNSKILVSIREPYGYLTSLYHQQRLDGIETKTFEDAYHADPRREHERQLDKGLVFPSRLHYKANYGEKLRRLLQIFEPSNVNIILFDSFKDNNQSVMNDVYDFLGVQRIDIDQRKIHTRKSVRFRWLKDLVDELRLKKALGTDSILYSSLKPIYNRLFLSSDTEEFPKSLKEEIRQDHKKMVQDLNQILQSHDLIDTNLLDKWDYI
jgi:hypothetical protein